MKKVMKVLMPVMRGFVLCAMALQIVLGIVYIGANITAVPQFQESSIYLELIPHQTLAYGIQIAAGLYSVYYFVYTWTKRKGVSFLFALWMNTIPFVAQAHVTLLPHSLAMSCLIWMLLQILKANVNRRPLSVFEWAVLFVFYVLLAQAARGYLLVGTVFIIWGACLQFYMKGQKFLFFMVSILVCAGMFVTNLAIYKVTECVVPSETVEENVSSVFFKRFGVLTLTGKYLADMPEEIQQSYTGTELDDFNRYPYKIESEFEPQLVMRYGKERVNEIYYRLGMLGLTNATKDNLRAVGEDTLCYLFPIAYYNTWQDGNLKGATSWNYQQFLGESPVWASNYAKICHLLWNIGFVISIIVLAVRAVYRRKLKLSVWLGTVIAMCFCTACMALTGTNAYDYKLALLPMILSYAPMGILAIQYIFNEG